MGNRGSLTADGLARVGVLGDTQPVWTAVYRFLGPFLRARRTAAAERELLCLRFVQFLVPMAHRGVEACAPPRKAGSHPTQPSDADQETLMQPFVRIVPRPILTPRTPSFAKLESRLPACHECRCLPPTSIGILPPTHDGSPTTSKPTALSTGPMPRGRGGTIARRQLHGRGTDAATGRFGLPVSSPLPSQNARTP